jgi:uncharacterized membrane protein YhaH (DUF805 family)
MSVTTTTRFGRRGAEPMRDVSRGGFAPASSAAAALAAATRASRPSSEPSLKSIHAPLPPQDVWAPASAAPVAGHEVAPPPSLMALLFSTKGRIRRRDYWIFSTLTWLIFVLAVVVLFLELPLLPAVIAVGVLTLVFGRVGAALRIKRWHDRDKSALWVWIGFVPCIGWLWAFVECALLEGTPGPNRYGLSPK